MAGGLYSVSVPVFVRMLGNLSSVLDKTVADADARHLEPSVLLASRLYPDMFPLLRQVQLACDFAKGAAARLAGVEVPTFPDDETTIPQLKDRIARVVEFVHGVPAEAVDAGATREVVVKLRDRSVTLQGIDYLNHMAMPNFYFHVTTAYAILRHNGVPLGKRDFVGV